MNILDSLLLSHFNSFLVIGYWFLKFYKKHMCLWFDYAHHPELTEGRTWFFVPLCIIYFAFHPRAYARGFHYLGIKKENLNKKPLFKRSYLLERDIRLNHPGVVKGYQH